MKKTLNIAYLNGTDGIIRKSLSSDGGGSGSGSNASLNISYYAVNPEEVLENGYFDILQRFAGLMKIKSSSDTTVFSIVYAGMGREIMGLPTTVVNTTVAIAGFNVPTSPGVTEGPMYNNWLDAVKGFHTDIDDWSWLTPITKEEFYNLEA